MNTWNYHYVAPNYVMGLDDSPDCFTAVSWLTRYLLSRFCFSVSPMHHSLYPSVCPSLCSQIFSVSYCYICTLFLFSSDFFPFSFSLYSLFCFTTSFLISISESISLLAYVHHLPFLFYFSVYISYLFYFLSLPLCISSHGPHNYFNFSVIPTCVIFRSRGPLHCRWILYQLSSQGSPI